MFYLPPASWWRFIGWLVLGFAVYTSFGFEGPRWMARVWKNPSGLWSRGTVETILGWLVMTALLLRRRALLAGCAGMAIRAEETIEFNKSS